MSGAQQRRTSRRSILPALTGGGYLAILILIAGLIVVAGALAVHASGDFELEGNIVDDPAPGPDWGSIFDASGNVVDLHGGLAAGFAMDDISPAGAVDHTVFSSGGTKNSGQPSTDWNWGTQSVPAK